VRALSPLVGVALVGSACGGAGLDRQIAGVAERLSAIETNGAMRCAPRELAIARSHLEFAQLEEEQGFRSRAQQHLDVAVENIAAASVLSSSGRCASGSREGAPSADEPPPTP
jgi:OOP family OmpA-OmpF porin